ncbi:hypothetical protein EDB85DRAFT_2078445 [Lactarius pseudohatsudake]|nr:hypothetical protein EDB85DRAFT_2078445 [Lactarius pseudohatsudake]
MDFRYLAQAPEISEQDCVNIDRALQGFHDHKSSIVSAGVRIGKRKKVLKEWYIPKLELMQSVSSSIRENGAAIQWTADTTERCHITEIKVPSRSSNKQGYESQICRYLDREEKCRQFDLATSIREAKVDFHSPDNVDCEYPDDGDGNVDGLSENPEGPEETYTWYNTTGDLLTHIRPVAPVRDPTMKAMSVEDAMAKFNLPDLRELWPTSGSLRRWRPYQIGGRRVANRNSLPTLPKHSSLDKVQLQGRSYYAPNRVLSPQTVNASPPSESWPCGHQNKVWPYSGLEGHRVAQIRLIFRAVPSQAFSPSSNADLFLSYVQRFDIVPQPNPVAPASSNQKGSYPHPITGITLVDLVPRLGAEADKRLTTETALEYSLEFWLNRYFDKELFYALK